MPKDYRSQMEILIPKLSMLQRELKDLEVPVMIAFEGYGASGKGVQISELIQALDPRGFEVFPVKTETREEKLRPFLWRFWSKLPEKGRISIFDSSWYRKVLIDRFNKKVKKAEVARSFESIREFEKQLTDDGMILIKIFLSITKEEQSKRFKKLLKNKDTAWRVSAGDLERNHKFKKYKKMNEEMLEETDTYCAPWIRIDGNDRKNATLNIYKNVITILEQEVEVRKIGKSITEYPGNNREYIGEKILAKSDLSLTLDRDTYKKKLKELQNKIERLHNELYYRRIPLVIGFEGWDAGGKGGAIKRLTKKMDPRGYVVHPTAAPNAVERQYHYLWRFWNDVPKAGHITIFDRTWYGRVMVERIEGFAKPSEWQRAYKEMNDMERDWADFGCIVLKFWLNIDKDEQERRFKERQNNPDKSWKITDEDWRNREKWDQYEEAVDEMLLRTSTTYAPWIVVEGNCKYYARIKVLETVVEAIEKRLSKESK
ncbi:polyphosphate:AMP phosphotransferase [Aequitasia blattaphilus]|uniref:Polyphosphate:AMP phosphotransferase n=1 Tax=Aequitasia blattaphilus TaxID=2949332 RepID=A0ABT1E6Q4_9FIRM|nr:polyphosphate:AMP phosphotransferase [Aequitasia blattaphilus]MCP1101515.1 polyphosphate:AMP phosphotransferase [Aequitasia blattaphilus]MCR8614155.1 polyphosphate:AMP phosphotransferase [Aequitasia blattaphilus]